MSGSRPIRKQADNFRIADHSPRTSSFALHNTISGPDGHRVLG
jgi:hypothetical protein